MTYQYCYDFLLVFKTKGTDVTCNPISVNRFNQRIHGDEDLRIADLSAPLFSRKMSAATRKYLPKLPSCFAYDTHAWICMPFKKLITILLHLETKDASHPEQEISSRGREEVRSRKLQLAEIAFPTGKMENWHSLECCTRSNFYLKTAAISRQ